MVGIKEAGGNADRVSQLRAALGRRFSIFSGDDSLTLPFMSVGAHGVVSVASNVVPRQVVANGARPSARATLAAALQDARALYPLFKDLFIETNPLPGQSRAGHDGQSSRRNTACRWSPMSAKNRATLKAPSFNAECCAMTKIIIAGAKGRMGQALAALRANNARASPSPAQIDLGDDLGAVIGGGDVVIDFTSHEVTVAFARLCAARQKAMVIGTTGHTEAERKELTAISARNPDGVELEFFHRRQRLVLVDTKGG